MPTINLAAYFTGTGMRFSADKLPKGMRLDARTGIVSGEPDLSEIVTTVFTAANDQGTAALTVQWAVTPTYGARLGQDYGSEGDFFVDPVNGRDDDGAFDGRSPRTAFKTIGKGLAALKGADTSRPGQSVLKLRGGIYREAPSQPGWAGTAEHRLVIEPYKDEQPVISGADILSGWEQCSSADSAVLGPHLGVDGSPVYKITVPLARISKKEIMPGITAFLHEAGRICPLARDRLRDDPPEEYWMGDSSTYHRAKAFILDGKKIRGVHDPAVIGAYSAADQLIGQYAHLHAYPNIVVTAAISAADIRSGTIHITNINKGRDVTVQLMGSERTPRPDHLRYEIIGVPARITKGTWGCVDDGRGNTTLYFWPNDPANLAKNIERSVRAIGFDVSDGNYITLRGLSICQQTGHNSTHIAAGISDAIRKSAVNTGLVIRDCLVERVFNLTGRGSGAIQLAAGHACEISHCTIRQAIGMFGLSVGASHNNRGLGNLISHIDIDRAEQSPFRTSGQQKSVFAYLRARRSGRADHANMISFYQGSDAIYAHGLDFRDCNGYITPQGASRIYLAHSIVQSLGEDGRMFVDQNGPGFDSPHNPSDNYIFNCVFAPRPTQKDVYALALGLGNSDPNSILNYALYNTVTNGAYIKKGRQIDRDANIYTKFIRPIHNYGDADGVRSTDVRKNEKIQSPKDTYANYLKGDLAPRNGTDYAAGTLRPRNNDDLIVEIKAALAPYHQDFDFKRDALGRPFTAWKIGPYSGK